MAPKEHICTQGERITTIETTLDLTNKAVMDKISNMDKKIDNNHQELKDILASFESKFASKRVEVALKWAIGIIVGIVLSAMVYNVIIK